MLASLVGKDVLCVVNNARPEWNSALAMMASPTEMFLLSKLKTEFL